MAGLSVAFDASCEEMWLAWRYGAWLVPAPRSLVRSRDGPRPLAGQPAITVVSTVPTLAGLWPADALDAGPAADLRRRGVPAGAWRRLRRPDREVWNTYGPTETTVVACGARLACRRAGADRPPPGRLGPRGGGRRRANRSRAGETVSSIIGGVGLARYLDPAMDAEKFAPLPTLGWASGLPQRRPGPLNDPAGLVFVGRADDQVKVGGRRIELGEVDAALLDLPGVDAAPRPRCGTTASGAPCWSGTWLSPTTFDLPTSRRALRGGCPAALVPAWPRSRSLPTRTSGKIDRDALPWPLPTEGPEEADPARRPPAGLAQQWAGGPRRRRARPPTTTSSTSAAAAWQRRSWSPRCGHGSPRSRSPTSTTTRPSARGSPHSTRCDAGRTRTRVAAGPPRAADPGRQTALAVPLRTSSWSAGWLGLRWVTVPGDDLASAVAGRGLAPDVAWRWVLAGWSDHGHPARRMGLAALGARMLLRGVRPRAPTRAAGAPTCACGLPSRWPTRCRRREPRRRPLDAPLRPRPRGPVGTGRRPARRAAGDRVARPRRPSARSSPRWT